MARARKHAPHAPQAQPLKLLKNSYFSARRKATPLRSPRLGVVDYLANPASRMPSRESFGPLSSHPTSHGMPGRRPLMVKRTGYSV